MILKLIFLKTTPMLLIFVLSNTGQLYKRIKEGQTTVFQALSLITIFKKMLDDLLI